MNWNDLKVLLALARVGTTRKAAKRLFVSNTTVMRRLESLEDSLGGLLFDRTPDGYRATALAEQLLPIAREVEDILVPAERSLTGQDADLEGVIKVSLPVLDLDAVSSIFAQFSEKYPRIKLDISASESPVDLARREADFAIRALPLEKRPPKDIVGIKLGPISIGYYVHQALLSSASRGLQEMSHISASPQRLSLGNLASAEDLGLSSRHVIDGLIPRLSAVKSKLGVAVLPCFLIENVAHITRLPGVPSVRWGHVWMLHHKDLRQSARIRALFEQFMLLEQNWPAAWDTSEVAAKTG